MGLVQAMQDIRDGEGYTMPFTLAETELSTLRNLIKSQYLYRLQLLAPEHVNKFNSINMEQYHELAYLINHSQAWPTESRVLPNEAAVFIRQTHFFKELEITFGQIGIADEAKFGWENLLWRLVRPGNTDCGPLHADRWFWDIAENWSVPDYPHERINVWIAIWTVVGMNGLLVVPASHHKEWKWHYETRYGQKKPRLEEDTCKLNLKLLPAEPGKVVMFSHDLLHGGAENLANTTRVSLEFTIFVPKIDR